jgi:hypothetical protein
MFSSRIRVSYPQTTGMLGVASRITSLTIGRTYVSYSIRKMVQVTNHPELLRDLRFS